MRDFKCNDCHMEFKEDSKEVVVFCPYCLGDNVKRLWTTSINMNGHGYKNNFNGNK